VSAQKPADGGPGFFGGILSNFIGSGAAAAPAQPEIQNHLAVEPSSSAATVEEAKDVPKRQPSK